MNDRERLRVAIDAEILPWNNGGVAHALLALIRALAALPESNESYCLTVATKEEEDYWRPQLGPNQSLAVKADYEKKRAQARGGALGRLAARAKAATKPWVRRMKRRISLPQHWPEVPLSDGFYESLGCQVMHFTSQPYTVCALPTIYNPHDLQHLHLPQFWPAAELARRDKMYSTGCRFARNVIVGSQWAKDDFVRQYALDPAKVQVIPEGPQILLAPSTEALTFQQVRDKYRLPETYLFYPAITWAHKNHLRLLDALALLRDERGLHASLVCTGSKREEFWPQIEQRIRDLRLEKSVHFLGFVPEADLRAIQHSAQAMVQTSLFEASSLPIFDAWLEGVPVACSRATALPEQLGNAGLLFDPLDPRDIANVVAQLVTNPDTRRELSALGTKRLKDFDWSRTAKAYRAIYRRAANLTLNEEDRWVLQWDWMREPGKQPPKNI